MTISLGVREHLLQGEITPRPRSEPAITALQIQDVLLNELIGRTESQY